MDDAPVLQIHNDGNLEADCARFLGDDPLKNNECQSDIHSALAIRWSYILLNGLTKDDKEKLLHRYSLPANCEGLCAPTLNPEITGILSNPHLKRDMSLINLQQQLCKGLTALAGGFHLILDEKELMSKELKGKIVECLGDSGRILSDLNYGILMVRRMLILSSLSKSIRETVEKTKPFSFFLWDGVGENLCKRLVKISNQITHKLSPGYLA